MANFSIKFYGTDGDNNPSTLTCNYDYEVKDIIINLNNSYIYLDKSTAIKIAKTLRTEINKMTAEEVKNGSSIK